MKGFFVLVALLTLLGAGCAERKAVAPSEGQMPAVQQPQTKAEETAKGPERITDQVAKVESKDIPSGMERVEEVSGMFKDIHFDYDKYDIREDAKPILKSLADHLIKNSAEKLLIEGHCDERGTNEYNLALGDRRAKAAKDYLVSLGVPSSRLETISYGEEKPLCNEHTEDCWARNRRAHFIIIKGKGTSRSSGTPVR